MTENTELLFGKPQEGTAEKEKKAEIASLFVCQGRTIMEYSLSGCQSIGRPADGNIPDIPVPDRFVSRVHGYFDTKEDRTVFQVRETTNGVLYKGELLEPGTELLLHDGDELVIPSKSSDEQSSVIIIYTCTEARINLWREFRKASKDKLTGLFGRDCFETWWYQNCGKKDYRTSVLFILDIDDFKVINDEKGHNAGDEALKIVANELKRSVRYENQVCRWGGDEFVGIIPGTPRQAQERLDDLRKRIIKITSDADVAITVSIGFTEMQTKPNIYDLKGILGVADKALYQSKKGRKGSLIFI